jgi:putative tryptophan/tyrosine transport system substrate-binding protein
VQQCPSVAHDLETDPVASGLIESYGRPGGTVTGIFFDFPEIRAKWLELLQEVVPALSRIGLVWDPASGSAQRDALVSATDGLNISAITIPVRALSELESAFEMAGREKLDALLILSSPLFGAQANLLADLALRHKLPTVTLFPDFARAGGLMAYGRNLLETYRPLGRMIAQILRGAAPGEIAAERPSKFELGVNVVRAARAIGLTVPTAILLRADGVIE